MPVIDANLISAVAVLVSSLSGLVGRSGADPERGPTVTCVVDRAHRCTHRGIVLHRLSSERRGTYVEHGKRFGQPRAALDAPVAQRESALRSRLRAM